MSGKEFKPDSSWAWSELDNVQEARGGAPAAHRDALKLMGSLERNDVIKKEPLSMNEVIVKVRAALHE